MTKKFLAAILSISLLLQIGLPVVYGEGVATDKTRETGAEETKTIMGFADLAEEIAYQRIMVGSKESEINLPDTLSVTLDMYSVNAPEQTDLKVDRLMDITWEIDMENSDLDIFDSREAGSVFFYKPIIDSKYTMVEGISLPKIKVQVEDDIDSINTMDDSLGSPLPSLLMDTGASENWTDGLKTQPEGYKESGW